MSEQKQGPLNPLTSEILEAAAAEAFGEQLPSEPDTALKFINNRLDLGSNQISYREKFLRAVADGDWMKISPIAKEQFATLHRTRDQKKFLLWYSEFLLGYGQSVPGFAAEIAWCNQMLELISRLKDAAAIPPALPILSLGNEQGDTAQPSHRGFDGSKVRKNKSQVRSDAVAKINKELHVIKASIEAGAEDYDRLRQANPAYLTFRAVKQSPQLQDRVLALPEHTGRLLRFAQELAGVLHGAKLNTIKNDWKKYKPAEHRRSSASSSRA
jgi:hypothetical protein